MESLPSCPSGLVLALWVFGRYGEEVGSGDEDGIGGGAMLTEEAVGATVDEPDATRGSS